MAMIKTDGEGLDINGRIGGTIFRFDQCGQHMQKEPRFILHWSPKQKRWMRAWSIAASYWKDCCRFGWFQEWWEYADKHPVPNRKGEMITLQPFNMWLKINVYRILNGVEIAWHPPND